MISEGDFFLRTRRTEEPNGAPCRTSTLQKDVNSVTLAGTVSTATHFCFESGLEIVDFASVLYSKSRDASELLRKRRDQLHNLVDIAKQMADVPPLQTDTAVGILYLYIGESKELLAILRKILPPLGMDSVGKSWNDADGVA